MAGLRVNNGKHSLKKLVFDCVFVLLMFAGFWAVLYALIKAESPETYFIVFVFIQIAAFLYFSAYAAAVIAVLSTLVAITAVITGSLAVKVFGAAAILIYWGIVYFLSLHISREEDDCGRNKILLENMQMKIAEIETAQKQGAKLIPELKKGIASYEKMAEFSLKLGTTFSLKDISMFIIKFTRSIFPEAEVSLIKQAQDACDSWVQSTQKSVYIENTDRDYKFDLYNSGDAASIIACPVFDGEKIQSIIKVKDEAGKLSPSELRVLTLIATLSSLAVENVKLFETTQNLSITDDLTELYNHSYFMERLREEISRASRHGEEFVFLMLDIDHFKKFNDDFGHPSGDEVIRRVSAGILKSLRTTDIVGRYGGEEFSVILPRTDLKRGLVIAEHIRKTIKKERFDFDGKYAGVTVTVGVSSFQDYREEAKIIVAADEALYEGKKKGRDRVVSRGDLK
ncbi:sensor domain-containing diguanylate cyclase [bacterium]|nr:GGDEF domain-containing protein [bacterium]MBU3955532.1 sensor domain-containing diguanylate cyclase [bacterium]